MTGMRITRVLHGLLAASFAVLFFATGFFSCAGSADYDEVILIPEIPAATEPANIPLLHVPTPQTTAFNGHPQPLYFAYEGDDHPIVTYFPSQWALEDRKGGSHNAPTRIGTYYVLVQSRHEEAQAEYRIVKSPVNIRAEEKQEAIYDGNPKRIFAEAEPHVPLVFSYYPNRELMETAIRAAMETSNSSNPAQTLSRSFQGYRRVERAPTEQGTYYVWIYYPGDDNHLTAEKRVVFTILPAVPALPQQRQ